MMKLNNRPLILRLRFFLVLHFWQFGATTVFLKNCSYKKEFTTLSKSVLNLGFSGIVWVFS